MIVLSPHRVEIIAGRLDALVAAAQAARSANALDDVKRALDEAWSCTRLAYDAINDAEQATRREALAKLGEVA